MVLNPEDDLNTSHDAGVSPAPVFDPATLNPTGRWKAYAGSPWANIGTAGGYAQASTPPAASSGGAIYDGVDEYLAASLPWSAFFGGGGSAPFGGIVYVYIDEVTIDATSQNANDSLLCTRGTGYSALYLRNNAGTKSVHYYVWNGAADVSCFAPVTTGAWVAIHRRYTGTHIQVGVGGVWGLAVEGVLNTQIAALTLDFGGNIDAVTWSRFKKRERLFFNFSPTDQNITDVIGYFDATYR